MCFRVSPGCQVSEGLITGDIRGNPRFGFGNEGVGVFAAKRVIT